MVIRCITVPVVFSVLGKIATFLSCQNHKYTGPGTNRGLVRSCDSFVENTLR
jgi:hypothetical protein